MFMLCENGTVYVVDTSKLDGPRNTIEVPEMKQPCDVTVNREQKQLFIADNTMTSQAAYGKSL